jgi:chemotaxis protein methyltransferase CheR
MNHAATLSRRHFDAVSQFFFEQSGIRLGPDKLALVQGRLQRLAADAGRSDIDDYVDWVLGGGAPGEVVKVVDKLTTNETYFFREPQHFQFLAEVLAKHRGGAPFRVWSAASSTGEEAFSIAMVLRDRLGSAPWEVVGTDLSTSVVDTAATGLYPMSRAEGIPEYYRNRHCLRGHGRHEGQFLMARDLRERVQFLPANLLAELPPLGQFDVIFLRNVLIYFDTASKAQIVRAVMQHLAPGGHLLSGHSESLANLQLPLRTVRTAVYARA